jgi:transposase
MQEDIENHLGYKWLTGDKAIDHSTMGKFYAKYLDEIVELFSQVVTICKKQDLIDFDILAIDSMKLRANASHKQSKSLESIEKEVEKIKKRVRELIEAATEDGTIHQEEERALAARMARLKEAKSVLKQRIEEKAEGEDPKEKRKLQKKEKINVTDFDAHIMQQANREQNPAYSISTATDTAADVITHFQVNARNDDEAALMDAIKGSRKATGQKHEVVDADSGFASRDNYERLEKEGQEALIPDHRLEAEQRGETSRGQYDRSKFIYDERIDTYICPCGARLSKMAELTIQGIQYHRYANASACKECDFRDKCTPGKYRSIYRDRKEEFQERMRGKLKVEENQAKYNKRAHASESPYGNLKRNLKFTYVMRRGIEKVRMEMAMLFMLHNILKAAPVLMEGGP